MFENVKKIFDQGFNICSIFMNLSKAFHTLNYDSLIAKLGPHG